jgi:AraC-like DNA-binding protein
MLQEYSIADILSSSDYIPYFVGTFEDTQDPDIEWEHRHSFYSLVWFTEGSGFYVVDFQEYEIKPQRIFIVSTKQVHNWDYSENSKGYILMTDVALGLALDINCPFPFVDVSEPYISTLGSSFNHLIHEFELKDDLSTGNIKAGIQYVYSLVRRIASLKNIKPVPHSPLMEQLKSIAFENNTKPLPVESYAENLHISMEELNAVCKASTGISVKQYLLDLKITEAKRMLLFGKLNINEIAFRLGFEDSSYFSRIFKKKTDLSPSDFLEKYRKQR